MGGETITTGVDRLLHLVEEQQDLSMDRAATILNVETGLVEEWANMLEERGLVRINHSLTDTRLQSNECCTRSTLLTEVKRFKFSRANIHTRQQLLMKERQLKECTDRLETQMKEFTILKKERESVIALQAELKAREESLEMKFSALKKTHSDLQRSAKSIAARQDALSQKERVVQELESSMKEREKGIVAREKALAKREKGIKALLDRFSKLSK